jgi:L-ascorbate metabolism protein UlaG (beta-lactamase superfamily)
MDIYWLGQACFKIKGKNTTILIDPYNEEQIGLKLPKDLSSDVVLSTHDHEDHNNTKGIKNPQGGVSMVFNKVGEYEIGGAIIAGIASFHDNNEGVERGANIIFRINMDRLNIVHLGDLGQTKLSEDQVTQIGQVDILLIPVGSVYTIDGKQASEIVSQLEPRIIIPMHFKIEGLLYALEGKEVFLKEMGAEEIEPQPKLSITKDKLPDESQVVILSKS